MNTSEVEELVRKVAEKEWSGSLVSELAAAVVEHPDPLVRRTALGFLLPKHSDFELWERATHDPDTNVRRLATELSTALGTACIDRLVELLADPEPLVVEAAAFSLGELGNSRTAVAGLESCATSHEDPLARESAVAALGSLRSGLNTILSACNDKPAIRRRAVIALSAFEGSDVDNALQKALSDKDWQTRQAAEDIVGRSKPGPK